MNIMARFQEDIFIIAEIGNNHNGDISKAKQLIDIASEAGVDAVKFQTFRGKDIVTPHVLASEYPGWNIKNFTYWYEFLDSIALPMDAFEEVFEYARSKGVIPFSTPTSVAIVDFLETIQNPIYKIASMDVTNVPLLRRVAATKKPVIMSTGMADHGEIIKAVNFFEQEQLILLHCVSDYPLDYANANLKTIPWLQKEFKCCVGFSDHSLGWDVPLAAIGCGAQVIEKHITLDRQTPEKAEHHFSLEPQEFKDFVQSARRVYRALGKEGITVSPVEKDLRKKARRSLHVNKDLKQNALIREEDLAVLRPANGDDPSQFDYYIGKKVSRDMNAWEPLLKKDL